MDVNKFDTFDMGAAMDLVNDFLETFNEYIGDGDEIDASYLPETIKAQFNDIAIALKEIKERETKVDEFKKRLYNFLCEKGIKSVSNDVFSMTLVFPAESKSFDHKKYLADEMAKHPRKTQKIIEKYTKTIKKSGFVKISLKEKKTNND